MYFRKPTGSFSTCTQKLPPFQPMNVSVYAHKFVAQPFQFQQTSSRVVLAAKRANIFSSLTSRRFSSGNSISARLVDPARLLEARLVSKPRTEIHDADQRIEEIAKLAGSGGVAAEGLAARKRTLRRSPTACRQVDFNYPLWTQAPQEESHCRLWTVRQNCASFWRVDDSSAAD